MEGLELDLDLMESMLDMEASMDILSDKLDRISLYSSAGSESAHSSSKCYDSAFGSHYSEDSASFHSQGASHTDPPPSYHHHLHHDLGLYDQHDYGGNNFNENSESSPTQHKRQQFTPQNLISDIYHDLQKETSPNLSISKHASLNNPLISSDKSVKSFDISGDNEFESSRRGLIATESFDLTTPVNPISNTYKERPDYHLQKKTSSTTTKMKQNSPKVQKERQNSPKALKRKHVSVERSTKPLHTSTDESSRPSTIARNWKSANIDISTAAILPQQVEILHTMADHPVLVSAENEINNKEDSPLSSLKAFPPVNSSPSAVISASNTDGDILLPPNSLQAVPTVPSCINETDNCIDSEHSEVSGSGLSTPVLQSSLSSTTLGSLSSEYSTPTDMTLPDLSSQQEPEPIVQRPLTPKVTILHPGREGMYSAINVTQSPRQPRIPKKGTVFYQDSLSPPKSPHLKAYRERNNEASSPKGERKVPKRNPSILQRFIRKSGSFKQEGMAKRRLPVKRSLSSRVTYNIRKGWIDYEEDLNLISQPTQPRAIGRMVDKKSGKYHMVQLYRPPSGKYGIYISETLGKKGVFISRFADQNAAKFYNGLISPGDQIIRVNGQNISERNSVDDVYDLMTVSDSVIFTVIPISMRSDW